MIPGHNGLELRITVFLSFFLLSFELEAANLLCS